MASPSAEAPARRVLALAGTNALAAVVFALIYSAAATRRLTEGAFLASLVVFFVALTALWVRIERSRRGARDTLSRVGRGTLALVVVILGAPMLVLTPLFALQAALPPEAGFVDVVRPIMVLLLISLALVVTLNVAGMGVLAVIAVLDRFTDRGR